jgi:drug/metabolite transporter (DMT)-like permease
MSWLIIPILSYFILAIVFLVDKYLLTGSIQDPGVYTFYIGILGILGLFLIPFVGFYIPEISQIAFCLLSGAIFIFALFWFNKALYLFETSRVVPAIGGLVPLFTFGLVYIFSSGKEKLPFLDGIAFILLILGSILITLEKEKFINWKSFQISSLAAFLFSLSFVFTKYIYLKQSFWNGYIWIRIGWFLAALCSFLFIPEIKKEIFKKKISFKKKTMGIFLSNQAMGAVANILQNWAIALAPLAYIAVINALQGIQYVFLLIFTVILSVKFPQILKEEISKKILFQKIFAVLLIGGGLALLAFK